MNRIVTVLSGLLLLSLPLRTQTLQLADGELLLASVEDATGEGLRVRRLDNGGMLELRWDHLTPECALRIKQSFALAGTEEQELTVAAYEVRYLLNGSPQTLVGRIVDEGQGGDKLTVQQKGVVYQVPRAELQQVRKIEVPVTQVFTRDEFYSDRLQQIAPGDSADKHMRLAEELIKVRDYEHALQHLEQAHTLGNSRAPQQLVAMRERMQLYIAAAKERGLLDQIQVARARGTAGEFEKGLKLIAQFERDFPPSQSKLKSEFDTEKKRFAEARARFLSQQVAEAWRRTAQTVAEKKVLEPGLTLKVVRQYAEEQMGAEIAAQVAARTKLEVEEVKTLFAERAKYPVGRRTELFAYGIGSWVLGPDGVLKGTKQGEQQQQQAPKDPGQERELERIARLIRKAKEQRRASGQGPQAQEQTDEEWWADASKVEQAGWLRAYYAEFGGDLVLTAAFTQPCITCFASGTMSELGKGGKVETVPCYLCHGSKWLRSFKAY